MGGRKLFVRRWRFRNPGTGQATHAFKTVWSGDDDFLRDTLFARDLREARLEVARAGQEFSTARMILAVIFGFADQTRAWEDFQTRVLVHLIAKGQAGPR